MSSVRVSPALQDYLEVILRLSQGDGGVRVSDIAAGLRNSKPTVTQAVGVLRSMRLVSQERYGRVHLTREGIVQAEKVLARHQALRAFLVDVLRVTPSIAESDACSIEHVISEETLEHLRSFMSNRPTGKSGAVKETGT
ncbi:MAG: metal-dependent transcriptional regulator [Ignavibacteriales bacterium]